MKSTIAKLSIVFAFVAVTGCAAESADADPASNDIVSAGPEHDGVLESAPRRDDGRVVVGTPALGDPIANEAVERVPGRDFRAPFQRPTGTQGQF